MNRDRTVAAVCHAEAVLNDDHRRVGSRVLLDRMEVWQGSRDSAVQLTDVEQWIEQASSAYNGAHVIADPYQAVGLMQRLQERGVWVRKFDFTAQSVGQLASTLHLLLRNRQLSVPDDPDLLDELAHVRLRETAPGVLRLDHDSDRHDDRAVALALAAHELTESGVVGTPVKPYVGVGTPHEIETALGGLGDLIDHITGEIYL